MIRIIKFIESLIFNPERDAIPPPPGQEKGHVRKSVPIPEPDNVVRDGTKAATPRLYTEDKKTGSSSWDLWTPGTDGRTETLTDKDKAFIRDPETKLKETTYKNIKALWARGSTGVEIERELTRQYKRGYSESTVFRYLKYINRAHLEERRSSSPAA